jgi:hypothetical protein
MRAESKFRFRCYRTPGFDADGSRKDWIATSDVYAWLTHISAAGA